MSKSSKFLTTILLGAASGAAAAIFLASKTGKAVRDKAGRFVRDYKENPEAKHSEWADKAADLKNQAAEKYSDVKHKFETGEITADSLVHSVKEKATEIKDRVAQDNPFSKAPDDAAGTADEADESDAEDAVIEGVIAGQQSEEITIDIADESSNNEEK